VVLIGEINTFALNAISAKNSAMQCAKEFGIGPGKDKLYLDVHTFMNLHEARESFRNNPLDSPAESVPDFQPLR